MKKQKVNVCSVCDTFIGEDGFDSCPLCGHDLFKIELDKEDEEE